MPGTRLRRARALHISWHHGRLTFENYLTRQVVSADPLALSLLHFFDDWRTVGDLIARLPEYRPASIRQQVRILRAHTLLLREGSKDAARDQAVADEWRAWLPHGAFHFGTKDVPFASPRAWRRIVKRFLAESPQPPIFKTYPKARHTRLPAPPPPAGEFLRVLLGRQTHRAFSGAPVPLEAIATLLHYTWGATGDFESPNYGRLLHKTSPSGGARHPGEVYLVAFDVTGLTPGVYHFNVRDHSLDLIRRGQFRRRLLADAVGQAHVGAASAVFVMTTLFARSSWKYRSPRAYRVVTLDTGHLGQTFCLVATWLGLAPFTTAALRDSSLEALLGLDGITESVMYLAGVGLPVPPEARPRRRRATRSATR
jgi:SagB-type dehydrogenase family enzyme